VKQKKILEVVVMKSLINAVVLATVLAAPVASFAQSSQQPVTRAEVRADLIQVEKAGYNPATSNDASYPGDIQAAERRVQAQNPAVAQASATDTGYGAATSGSSQMGSPGHPLNRSQTVNFGH
jgi:uncharacterized membrane protein